MFICMKFRGRLILGKSLKNLVHTLEGNFDAIFMKRCQNINLQRIYACLKLGHVGRKSMSLGQIEENHM